ncbi:MAG: alpha/beta family hydrolase [Bacteroidia bacterium]|nr:alpha/beta family hydrolase [Bacteroidia bacterium]
MQSETITVPAGIPLPCLWCSPKAPAALLVLAHGAGTRPEHPLMESIAQALAGAGIATLRYPFPFALRGGAPDRPAVAVPAVQAVVRHAASLGDAPLLAGGHSFGGRMTTLAAAEGLPVRGLVLLGFPLHAAGKPGTERAAHLPQIPQPMLFCSGTRDALAEASLLSGVVDALPQAALHWLEGADHQYRGPGKAGYMAEIAGAVRQFADRLAASPA